MSRRRALLLASAVLPALGAWTVARCTADRLASRVAEGANAGAGVLEWFQKASPEDSALAPSPAEPRTDRGANDPAPDRSAPVPRVRAAQRGSAAASPAPRNGFLIRRDAVAAAVRNGVRPSASAVAATADHPAGLIVYGWGGAGTALRDGDIIVSVGGRTPSSVDDVIAAVAGAYRHETYAVSGRIWRGGETFDVSVELPIPRDREARSDDDETRARTSQRAPRSTGGP